MSVTVRVIPCLDVDNGRVVKGVKFENIRDAGDPVEIARRYDEQGADEITFLDITASHERRGAILDVIARTADVCFMPLSVGGGIRQVEDARRLLLAGADKISVNTAAVENRDLISACADAFGRAITRHTADWHMMQRVFVDDLDPARDRAITTANRSAA